MMDTTVGSMGGGEVLLLSFRSLFSIRHPVSYLYIKCEVLITVSDVEADVKFLLSGNHVPKTNTTGIMSRITPEITETPGYASGTPESKSAHLS
jgi:hypothetical protein